MIIIKKMNNDLYLSLDAAREELRKRWNDLELRRRIEDELGDRFMPNFKENPRGVVFRQICSPDNGFIFFFQCAKYIGSDPLVVEYHDDMFTHLNAEKKGLGRLRVTKKDGTKVTVDIMNFHDNEKKLLKDVTLLSNGEKLTDFHRNLFAISGYDVEFLENSKWFHDIGRASDYYYYYLLHFIVHGVLFETFFDEGISNEDRFTSEVIYPTIKKIEEKFGIKLLIVRSYPANQKDGEDFYWWSYPSNVNEYVIENANNRELKFKLIN